MKKPIALLTCERLPELGPADQALIPLFARQGIDARVVIWSDPNVRWQDFDTLIIRTTWDYYKQADAFRAWLDTVERLGIPMLNAAHVVRDNMHKFYLRRFHEKGITIIPTLFSAAQNPLPFETLVAKAWSKVVIKPAVSAGSFLTEAHHVDALTPVRFQELVSKGDWLIQPFLPEIATQGETSLIFFNGVYSHAVLKRPRHGDFRVQKQYGGQYQLITPSAALLQTAQHIATQEHNLLYARVDGIMINNTFHLMELELIEPDLYFEFGEDLLKNFVAAVTEKIQS
jgi:glutathione synthase/RimK-type ligase-like ATP-grasp enzyme